MQRLKLPACAAVVALALVRPAAAEAPAVLVARIDGPVTAATADYLARAVAVAERRQAPALLVTIDTPGGDSASMLRAMQTLLNARVPTIAWVGPDGARAASAGTFIVLAAHEAGMAPRTTIGAASPVGPGGADLPATMKRKATEDAAATARALAARRNPAALDWAERAVRDAASASADEALRIGLVDAVSPSPEELLTALDGRKVTVGGSERTLHLAGAPLVELPPTAAEELLALLVHPEVALLLLALGVNLLLVELSHPGGFVAGTVGLIALLLGLYSLGVLDANLVGLVVLGAAFAMFVLDVKAPTHGLLTAGGIVLFIVGAVVLFAGDYYAVPWATIITLALGSGAFFAFVVGAAVRAMRRRPTTGREGLVGMIAEVRRTLAPQGTVSVRGELWRAVSADGSEFEPGAAVRIVGQEGFTLVVRAAGSGGPTHRSS